MLHSLFLYIGIAINNTKICRLFIGVTKALIVIYTESIFLNYKY